MLDQWSEEWMELIQSIMAWLSPLDVMTVVVQVEKSRPERESISFHHLYVIHVILHAFYVCLLTLEKAVVA